MSNSSEIMSNLTTENLQKIPAMVLTFLQLGLLGNEFLTLLEMSHQWHWTDNVLNYEFIQISNFLPLKQLTVFYFVVTARCI